MPEREFGLIVLRSGSKSFASRKISDRRSLRARFSMDIYSPVTRPSFSERLSDPDLSKSIDISSSQPGSDFKVSGRVQLRSSYELNSLDKVIKKIDHILNLNSNQSNYPGPNLPPSSSALVSPTNYYSPTCNFSDTYLGDDSIPYLCQQLILKPRINLILRGNKLSSAGAAYLSEHLLKRYDTLPSRSGVRYFFDQNFMTLYQDAYPKVQNRHNLEESQKDKGAKEEAFDSGDIVFNDPTYPGLQSLSLEWNQIGSTGAMSLANALLVNKSILHLNISNNKISSDGAEQIAEALRVNTTLKILDLKWNNIDDAGLLSFRYAILERKPPLLLLFNGNNHSESTTSTIMAWHAQRSERDEEVIDIIEDKSKKDSDLKLHSLHHELHLSRSENEFLQNEIRRLRSDLKLTVEDLEASRVKVCEQEIIFNKTISESQSEIERIKAETHQKLIKEREVSSQTISSVIKQKEDEVYDYRRKIEDLQNKLEKIFTENNSIKTRYEHLEIQFTTEKKVAKDEFDNLYSKYNIVSQSETSLKNENLNLNTQIERGNNTINNLRHELEQNKTEYEKIIKINHEKFEEELEKIKNEQNLVIERLLSKTEEQARVIKALQEKINAYKDELVKQRKELEDTYEAAIKSLKESEQRRYDELSDILNQKITNLAIARDSLQEKYDSLYKDMQVQKSHYTSEVSSLKAYIDELLEQLKKLREEHQELISKFNKMDTNYEKNLLKFNELLAKVKALETNEANLLEKIRKNNILIKEHEKKIVSLEDELLQERMNKEKLFNKISQEVTLNLKDSLEQLRYNLILTNNKST